LAYRIVISRRAERQFRNLTRAVQVRLAARIDSLAQNPRPPGAVRIEGTELIYRIRVGDYRVLYAVEERDLIVLVVKVGHRREVYRGIP
jgi:mRNA interferase RelE/StbE